MSDYNLKDYIVVGSDEAQGDKIESVSGKVSTSTSTVEKSVDFGSIFTSTNWTVGTHTKTFSRNIGANIKRILSSGSAYVWNGSVRGKGSWQASYSGSVVSGTCTINVTTAGAGGFAMSSSYAYYDAYETHNTPYKATIDLGSGNTFVSATYKNVSPSNASVSISGSGQTVNVTISLNGYNAAVSADIEIKYSYFQEEAKVKFNGVIYKHIKFNGKVIV